MTVGLRDAFLLVLRRELCLSFRRPDQLLQPLVFFLIVTTLFPLGLSVQLALLPIAAGHALSIWLVAASVMAIGTVVGTAEIRLIAGGILVGWAAYHWLYGHRHRVRVGMTVGVVGLALWSFLMTTAHGAGLMLVPALVPLCASMPAIGGGSLLVSLAAVAVHSFAMLTVTGLIALVVHEWIGLAFLRRSWINFDVLWSGGLVATGLALIITA